MKCIETRKLTASDATPSLCGEIAAIINEAYADGEAGLWREGAARTSAAEIEIFAGRGEIVVATEGERVVGAARVNQLSDRVAEFGMLSVALSAQRRGVGGALLAFIETVAKDDNRDEIQLEILCPRDWQHPRKEHLKDWYGRSGFAFVEQGSIESAYPQLAPMLVGPCEFLIYRKALRHG